MNAKEARILAERHRLNELNTILLKIEEACRNGLTAISVSKVDLDSADTERLEVLGYEVYPDGKFLTRIDWE